MPFADGLVEDGSGLATAVSYASVSDADAYHNLRGNSGWTGDDSAKQAALVRATDYVDSHNIREDRLKETQALKFPTENFDKDSDGNRSVPRDVKRAVYEYALLSLTGIELQPTPEYRQHQLTTKRERVGPIERESRFLAGGNLRTRATFPKADKYLSAYIYRPNRTYR